MESMGKKPRRRRSFTPEFKAEIVGLSLTEPAAATFIPAPLRVTSTTRRLTRWPQS
jgi:transposase-like protein